MADVQFTKSEFAFVADDFSVGFSNGWGKHKIAISNSKMLKVQELFDETPSDKPTLEDWFDRIDPAEGWPELLMPCFKTVGKGLTVTVTA